MTQIIDTAADIANLIESEQFLCLPPDYSGCAVAVILELVRQHRRGLMLLGVPQLGLQADLLVGAGCVATIDAAAVTLGEMGQAPRFVEAVTQGQLEMRDSTCPMIHAGLQAAEKGIPFMPLRGIIGSDLVQFREDWQVIDNPFRTPGHRSAVKPDTLVDQPDPILLAPAISPEVALFHAPLADVNGNVWIGVRRELMLMAHAARSSFVTVEKIVETDLLQDPHMAAGVIPSLYVSQLACVPQGASPTGLFTCYEPDHALLKRYAQQAKTQSGFDSLIAEWLAGEQHG